MRTRGRGRGRSRACGSGTRADAGLDDAVAERGGRAPRGSGDAARGLWPRPCSTSTVGRAAAACRTEP
ncbi:hypothetical protein ACFSM7_13425 [Clavibacter michiganensis subsp. tessellarius]|uniref:hypothetical protein n=1 Tax=Clavibacter tessellarius TaxID=31965 RepID=UPI0036417646